MLIKDSSISKDRKHNVQRKQIQKSEIIASSKANEKCAAFCHGAT
jgi:hypothetical protein